MVIGQLAAHHMQPVGDQRAFGFQQLDPQLIRLQPAHIDGLGLLNNQHLQVIAFRCVRGRGAPARQAVLQIGKALIQPRLRQRRRQMRDGDRIRPTLGQRGLGRVVRGVKIDVRHLADQPVRPIARAKACLLARHEFQRAMHAEMQDGIGGKGVAQPEIELHEGMCRGKATLEQQAHRIALIPEGGLQADKDIAQLRPKDKDAAPIALDAPRCRAPDRLDRLQGRGVLDDMFRRDHGGHIGRLAIGGGIALQHDGAQIIDRGGNGDGIAVLFHLDQGVVQAFKDAQIGRRPGSPGIGRKAEQHHAHLLVGIGRAAQAHHAGRLFGQGGDALMARRHGLAIGRALTLQRATLTALDPVPPGKDRGVRGPVNLWQGHQHRRLDRAKPAARGRPLAQRLEL